jgi:predicted amidohydrolase
MLAAAVQLDSNQNKEANLAAADRLIRQACAQGAQLVALPEKFNVVGTDADYRREAESLEGPTLAWARSISKELSIDLVAGSIPERRPGHDKLSNTSVHIGPDGSLRAVYRKIHLFDASVGEFEYRESDTEEAGEEIVVTQTQAGMRLGLAICYDIRFPEMFRILTLQGAQVIVVASNFTRLTGTAHWDVLIRARAIENQAFVIAPDQVGIHPPDRESYGGSAIVDPWGEILAYAAGGECAVCAEIDLERQNEVRERMPVLENRVPGAYRWPEGVRV